MANKLIINTTSKEHRIALLKHGKIIEYHKEEKDHTYSVGDIHLGTVKNVLPNLNAAFIDVGHEKDAFLHYLDLGEHFPSLQKFIKKAMQQKNPIYDISKIPLEPILKKEGNISQVLKKNDKILVQITKEAISTKGLRLSSAIAIPGRHLILLPFGNEINISKKITNKAEKERIKKLLLAMKPKNFSVIARTNAEKKEAAIFDYDFQNSHKKWLQGVKKLHKASCKDKIIKEGNRISSIIRDLLNESFDQIIVDDELTYKQVKEDVRKISSRKEKIIQFYKGKTNLFEHLDLERQIQITFHEIVNLENGGYIKIEQTEAMYTIDINSGSHAIEKANQEANALAVNLAAIREIFYQIRLRSMGGIIIIDCISMNENKNQEKLYQEAKFQSKEDPAKLKVLPLTEFGLMQITRQRTRPTPHVITQEICPACRGTKKIQNSLVIAQQIEELLEVIIKKKKRKNITLLLHPYLHAYFTKGIFSKQWHWFQRYFQWIKLVPDHKIPITAYKFLNDKNKIITTNPVLTLKIPTT